ncbi:MAG: aminodeoxychorismate synthase component I [Bacteroidales bacterium]|nr:aminodeoxychorismate synthase component I [Bacteroidales bacterium]
MNALGRERLPFLFIIDFEMKAIRLFPLDKQLPETVLYDFQTNGNLNCKPKEKGVFTFRKFPMSFEAYNRAFNTVQKQIYTGNSFLTNLTFPTPVETDLTLREIYLKSSAKYKIFLENEFVCFSPETFITIKSGIISTFPMKGTIKVSSTESEKELLSDTKEIAEHHTIVDLLRNDLSMVADSINVKRLRYVERIHTHEGELLQVSSEITGKLPDDYQDHLGEIMFKLLPAGSVTGAPKQKTVAIIQEAEKSDRGYYTGVCGVFDGNNLNSAVMIRFIENHKGELRFRSGGGITFLSNARSEYKELNDKVYVPIA